MMDGAMTRVYEWTEDEDAIALDAITVGIRSDTRILKIGGLQFGQRDALIYWPDWDGKGTRLPAAIEGPFPVQHALERAEHLRATHAFNRVVIWLQHRELWDERWGALSPIASHQHTELRQA
jgi:hypothetical protein